MANHRPHNVSRSQRRPHTSAEDLNQAATRVMDETEIQRTDALAAEFETDFVAVRDMVLLKIRNPRRSKGGVIIPEGAKLDAQIFLADVVAAGPGLYQWSDAKGEPVLIENEFKPGDVVQMIMRLHGQPAQVTYGMNEYIIVSEGEICGRSKKPSELDGFAEKKGVVLS